MLARTLSCASLVPVCARSRPSLSAGLHFAARAVKTASLQSCPQFRCPRDGSSMSICDSAAVELLSSPEERSLRTTAHVSLQPNNNDSTVLAIRRGALFLRCAGLSGQPALLSAVQHHEIDLEVGDVLAIVSRMTVEQTNVAVDSLLNSLFRSASVEEAAEAMLIDSNATERGTVMLSVISDLQINVSSLLQPPVSNEASI